MVCSARLLDVSHPLTSSFCSYVSPAHHNSRYFCTNPKSTVRWRSMSLSDPDVSMDASAASIDADSAAKNAAGFCIIEGPETVQDFDKMDIQEIQDNIGYVDAMLQKLEKEIDDVDAKIGDRWRVLDRALRRLISLISPASCSNDFFDFSLVLKGKLLRASL
ncbi:hypothetical protein Hanom_Chr12g01072151 [Helianthus anomalus]